MAWTEPTRVKYDRKSSRYQSDLTDEEWALLAPHLEGAPRKWTLRELMNAILYLMRTGCQWRMLPKDFPPRSTVYHWFARWRDDRTWITINHLLLMQVREKLGREASPTAGAIDTQSVKTTESGGPRGFDAGKKIKGRKREIVVDTEGHLITADIWPANTQDRDAAAVTLKGLRKRFPWLEKLFADSGYAGDKLRTALIGEAAPNSKSLSARETLSDLSSYHGDGSSNAALHGSGEIEGYTKTASDGSKPRSHASTSPASTCYSDETQQPVVIDTSIGQMG